MRNNNNNINNNNKMIKMKSFYYAKKNFYFINELVITRTQRLSLGPVICMKLKEKKKGKLEYI